ncbi:MAG TPA: altronate dehydratase family protein [Longimicrobiaceae bacterium]|jgi:altronate hydrolase|nr:altronate dehydratase family protein [Longimicrobiaceae bacterium]
MAKPLAVQVHPTDNVAVLVAALPAGAEIEVAGSTVVLREDVGAGHKVALAPLRAGETVVKYGFPIGLTTADVEQGVWVHSHNLKTHLEGVLDYSYAPVAQPSPAVSAMPTFMGYRRSDGRVGTRNEVWIVNTVGCVNTAADRIARAAAERYAGRVDGVHSFSHPYGCSQLGDDLQNTRAVLAGLIRHPNAGGVLVLGLGCENNQMDELLAQAPDVDRNRLRFFNTQDVVDEVEEGVDLVGELVAAMEGDRRVEVPASELVIGNKCGGSDGFSGITANPLVGRVADKLTGLGGGVILTEVPEMFGAEQVLMNRAASEEVFGGVVSMVNDFKDYFIRHGQPIYENPSPGNKAGGLTTLEEKSLGAIQKGGRATVSRVLRYGQPAAPGGLSLLEAPGNDGVSCTAMVASGATVLLFTTGRGTPLGFPVPTMKVSSNSAIAEKKPHWIDFNAGALLDGDATLDGLADELFARVLDVASGRELTNNEKNGYREIAIWKEGVTL